MGTTSKALSLLALFSRSSPQIGLSDMARRAGFNKATTYRLLTELAEFGFVEQIGSSREYRLGPAFLRLAALREATVPLREIASSVLHDLSHATGETTHMSLLEGHRLTTLAYAYSDAHGTQVRMEDATALMLHATSSGLAVLAFSPPEFVDQQLQAPLKARTAQTVTNPAQIRALLPEIRQRGYAVSVGGFELDVYSHAVPLFDANSRCTGAVAVAAPTTRMDDTLKTVIRRALFYHTNRLTRLLGGFTPSGFPTGETA
jgi:DNA-binding IclR family transcriptional regulator